MGRAISSKLFCPNKFTTISGIKSFLNKVCAIVFADILEQVLPAGQGQTPASRSWGSRTPRLGDRRGPEEPGLGDPERGALGWAMAAEPPVDERTMFLTFPRGYPVTEEEVRELFNSYYGDCVEAVKMVSPAAASEQLLYARLVVRSVGTIDQVLSGGPIAKFHVNGNTFGHELKSSLTSSSVTGFPLENVRNMVLSSTGGSAAMAHPQSPAFGIAESQLLGTTEIGPNVGCGNPETGMLEFAPARRAMAQTLLRKDLIPLMVVNLLGQNSLDEIALP
ncbi:unnamed protein product [Cuscuta campestris]|uniref:RRM domain-containing protein n=1 Tax=Cuscuta campestris TaxID=132261 RepID=A0A484MEJ9_9ASTE|nr:unnamed protein product [Cuscuta campestris]